MLVISCDAVSMGQLRTPLPLPSGSPGKESANAGLCFLAPLDALLLTAGGWGGWCLQFWFVQCSCIHMYPRYQRKSQSIPKYCILLEKVMPCYAHHFCARLWLYPRVAITPLSLQWMTWMTPRLSRRQDFVCTSNVSHIMPKKLHLPPASTCIHLRESAFSYLFWTGAGLLTRWERCADDPTGPTGRSTGWRVLRVLPLGSTLPTFANWEFHELPWVLKLWLHSQFFRFHFLATHLPWPS